MKCESQLYGSATHLNRNGTRDWGYWQINDIHVSTALKMGFDIINEPFDNLEYGFILLANEGARPWSASKYCWSPSIDG